MTRRLVRLERAGRQDTIDLDEYAAGDLRERSALSANAWIKNLRHAQVEGRAFRDRFTYRGDSLWWFAEIFLHKQAVIEALWRTALTLDALIAQEQPAALGVSGGDRALTTILAQAARRHDVRLMGDRERVAPGASRHALRSRAFTWTARASRWLPGGRLAPLAPGGALAFVHSAFWRPDPSGQAGERQRPDWDGEEGYIGSVLNELVRGAPAPVHLVGVGPRTNFRTRRWWHPLLPWRRATPGGGAITPVERFAARRQLADSDRLWRERGAMNRALLASEDIRARALIGGYDAWPIVSEELAGIATLQFPWSARAMDEAAAALDASRPRVIVTYAEAGGWGRAIVLEARRRGMPTVGLQHGFIYRHWLNYRHEADEMQPSAGNEHDTGFPRPSLTLVHDGYAAGHLAGAGQFPPGSVRVTGSPGLDRLAAALSGLGPADREAIREALGVGEDEPVALVVSKRVQLGGWLGALVTAARVTPGLRVVIKPHPAEAAEAYSAALAGQTAVRLAPAALDLASLMAVAAVVVTVNSTVAVDAMVLGIPALTVGLPNNLSPFVEQGAMAGVSAGPRTTAGAREDEALARELFRVVRDEVYRRGLVERAQRVAASYGVQPDGESARRAAAEIWRV